jgi:dTDP-4-dehydrorhamnose reductase
VSAPRIDGIDIVFLIVGGHSEIGSATARFIRSEGGDVLTTTRRVPADKTEIQFDLSKSVADFHIPDGVKSACIFIAVARLAACAADPQGSTWLNVDQTIGLVDRLLQRGIYTLFLSSNQVFSGEQPHVGAAAPLSPVSDYGRQKAKAEQLLHLRMTAGAPVGVLRLSKVVSPGMKLVADWKKELAANRPIQAFGDMTLAPVPVGMVAQSIASLMRDRSHVIAQLSGPRDVTYWELGRFLAARMGSDIELVRRTSAVAAGMPAGSLPRHTTLDSSLISDRYGLVVPDILNVFEKL